MSRTRFITLIILAYAAVILFGYGTTIPTSQGIRWVIIAIGAGLSLFTCIYFLMKNTAQDSWRIRLFFIFLEMVVACTLPIYITQEYVGYFYTYYPTSGALSTGYVGREPLLGVFLIIGQFIVPLLLGGYSVLKAKTAVLANQKVPLKAKITAQGEFGIFTVFALISAILNSAVVSSFTVFYYFPLLASTFIFEVLHLWVVFVFPHSRALDFRDDYLEQTPEGILIRELQKIIRVSNSIDISLLAQVVGKEESFLRDWIEQYAAKSGYVIKGNLLQVSENSVGDFIAGLETAFATWGKEGKKLQ